jgi:hypothetical protein
MNGRKTKSFVTILPRSVRSRYSLSAMLIAVTAYSLLLGLLAVLKAPPILFVDAVVFVTAIAIAMVFLFRSRKPRLASAITGAVAAALLAGIQTYWMLLDPKYPEGVPWAPYAAIGIALTSGILGGIVGYIVGVLIGLLFVQVEFLYRVLNPDFRPSDRALDEVKRRCAEFDAGRMKSVPWEEVEASVADLLKDRR